jgi:hypothetical protein
MHDADHDAAHRTQSEYIDDSAEVDHDPLSESRRTDKPGATFT